MIRLFTLIAAGLILGMTWLAPAEAAGKRNDQRATARPAPRAAVLQRTSVTPRAPVARTPARAQPRAAAPGRGKAVAAARGGKQAARAGRSGASAAASSCSRRDRKGRCIGQRVAVAATPSWQGGLPAMTMEQSSCPPGTMAVLARGHNDVTRCMPI